MATSPRNLNVGVCVFLVIVSAAGLAIQVEFDLLPALRDVTMGVCQVANATVFPTGDAAVWRVVGNLFLLPDGPTTRIAIETRDAEWPRGKLVRCFYKKSDPARSLTTDPDYGTEDKKFGTMMLSFILLCFLYILGCGCYCYWPKNKVAAI